MWVTDKKSTVGTIRKRKKSSCISGDTSSSNCALQAGECIIKGLPLSGQQLFYSMKKPTHSLHKADAPMVICVFRIVKPRCLRDVATNRGAYMWTTPAGRLYMRPFCITLQEMMPM